MKLEICKYSNLNSRQKENYLFQKLAAKLADYGYNCIRLSDDWNGADFLAVHVDGQSFAKIQAKSRLCFHKKYQFKDLRIGLYTRGRAFIYPHDEFLAEVLALGKMSGTKSWDERGRYSWSSLPGWFNEHFSKYEI
ncbi:hypothetical protein [Ruegeria arenilitoris]|uniref:hypothetical protein n=1 Tax=Ruegeria arenilitoris TaxID=1173585 RepID=UPI001479C629|nr:hypothetical protein [Ruegeria arenilitoris]